jgi:ribosomal peptide maturation radical SAM protein 1
MNSFAIDALAPRAPDVADVPGARVALVCMPFASADRPSIQLGLVGAIAEAAGHEVELFHFNLELAAALTPLTYEHLCERRAHLTGEWLFAPAAFGDAVPSEAAYFADFPDERTWLVELLGEGAVERLRSEILPAFVDRCCENVDWSRFAVVGFSSLFQQNAASLALARRIKARFPSVQIIFGGANTEGEMGEEMARAFPFIDHVVSGEAEHAFPSLLKSVAIGEQPPKQAGLISRQNGVLVVGGQAPPTANLDAMPVPRYDDYFADAARLDLADAYRETWTIPFESSRGCWWGQKHHCTFCGLNGLGMGFRSKSTERLLRELSALAERHEITSFMAVDNILDHKYFDTTLKDISERRIDFNFFYEIKANIGRKQVQQLFNSGVRRVQPGIESMSSHVLQLMNKGVTMLQNLACMKWCRYYGIGVNWNLLWGFPGETEGDYHAQFDLMKSIMHLEPPVGGGRIWLERFSPNFENRAIFPLTAMRPEASYAHCYPPHVDLMKLAYFFDYEVSGTMSPDQVQPILDQIEVWRTAWAGDTPPSLTYRRLPESILIDVVRGPDDKGCFHITGANADLYHQCSEMPRSVSQLRSFLAELRPDEDHDEADIREALELFCHARLMAGENDRYFALALPLNPNW